MNAKLDSPVCINHPLGVFVSNGEVFIADASNNRVRKLLRIVSIAGNGNDGTDEENGDGQLATLSQISDPMDVFVSSSNQVYISEEGHRIRKIDQHGIISTIAGGKCSGYNGDNQLAIHAYLNCPRGLFVTDDEEVYLCDMLNNRVRKIDRNGMISTVVGNGEHGYNGDGILATDAALNYPASVYVYKNEIYISDTNNNRIRKVLKSGIITTIAGTGAYGYSGDDQLAIYSTLSYSYGICVHNDHVYFSDYSNHCVRMILPNEIIKTIAGNDGKLAAEQVKYPTGIFVDDSGLYICCHTSSVIRKVDSNGIITTVVGTGERGYSGDVPFDFKKYPHIGPPRKKSLIKPFPHAYHDLIVRCVEVDLFDQYEPAQKKTKY